MSGDLLNSGEALNRTPLVRDRLQEHGKRPHPPAAVVVQRPVNDHRLVGFAVRGDGEHFVLAALEVSIPAWLDRHLTTILSRNAWFVGDLPICLSNVSIAWTGGRSIRCRRSRFTRGRTSGLRIRSSLRVPLSAMLK